MIDKKYYDMLTRNVNVFRDTRKLSRTEFREDTEFMKEGIKIYEDAQRTVTDTLLDSKLPEIELIDMGTVNAAYRKKNATNHVALLNFADAKKPGGWVEDGAPTQEENICRCTNLYEALITKMCDTLYYKKNNKFHTIEHITETYTDTIIYTPEVAIFKDDTTYERVDVKYVDVITCPAPCGVDIPNVVDILIPRMMCIFKAAYDNGVTDLILGAWGCGAFGQSPSIVAGCFASTIVAFPAFNSVTFAFKRTEGDNYKSVTRQKFEKELKDWGLV